MNTKYSFRAIQQGQTQQSHVVQAGAGQNGQALVLRAAEGTRYQLADLLTLTSPKKLQIKRMGQDLLLALPGNEVSSPDIVIKDYFNFKDMSLSGLAATSGNDANALQDASGNDVATLTAQAVSNLTPVSSTVLEAVVVGGPFIASMLYEVFDSSGKLLVQTVSDASGKVKMILPSTYTGLVLVRASSLNGNAVDYVDEKTGLPVNLEAPLRAYVSVTAGAATSLTVTPLTEIAVRKGQLDAGLAMDSILPPSQQAALKVNADVAQLFGLASITGSVTPIIAADGQANPAYNEADSLNTAAEDYGRVLAKLASNDFVTGSAAKTSEAYVSALRAGDAAQIAELLEQGAKAFEFGGSTQTAGYANLLDSAPGGRALTVPVGINRQAAERATGVPVLSDSSSNPQTDSTQPLADKQINLAESATGQAIELPIALPVQALAGDTLTVTVPGNNGAQTYTLSRSITAAEAGAGFAVVALVADALRASGDGDKRVRATLSGPASSAPGAQTVSISYDAWTLGEDADKALFSLDTKAPSAPTGQLDASQSLTPDAALTRNMSPLLSGTAEAGSAIEVLINNRSYATTANAQGLWQAKISHPLPASGGSGTAYVPQITATDAAGNKTTVSGNSFSVLLNVSGGIVNNETHDTGSSIRPCRPPWASLRSRWRQRKAMRLYPKTPEVAPIIFRVMLKALQPSSGCRLASLVMHSHQ